MHYLKYLTEMIRKDWRDKIITHITPKTHKVSRVKISSLSPEEQQKYNPNKSKTKVVDRIATDVTPEEIVNIKTVTFYTVTKDLEYFKNLKAGDLILVTNSTEYASKYFNEELIAIKLSNVPVTAIKKCVSGDLQGDDLKVDILDVSDKSELKLFELANYSDYKLFLLEMFPYLEIIKIETDQD